jgi:hypothetical protein
MKLRNLFFEITKLTIILSLVLIAPYSVHADNKNTTNPENKCTVIPSPDYQSNCGARYEKFLSKTLEKGECFEMEVMTASKWNASGVLLGPGNYKVKVVKTIFPLMDATICATPTGWIEDQEITPDNCPSYKEENHKGTFNELSDKFFKFYFKLVEPFRRAPDQDWFYLMGAVAGNTYNQFPIVSGDSFSIPPEKKIASSENSGFIGPGDSDKKDNTGEFCAFVNDLSSKYGNNTGSLLLRVTRKKEEIGKLK